MSFVRNVGSHEHTDTGQAQTIAGKARSFDLFDGGAGFDTLVGSKADDAILLDDSSGSLPGYDGPRVASIERISAGDGRDIVDLTSSRFDYGDVIVDGGADADVLRTSAGDDLLIGGRGDDDLAGGTGDDVYLYAAGDGEDTVRDNGGADTLAFGEGIAPTDVRFERHHSDLVLRLARRGGGSVTIADWFASAAHRLEHIQFANGAAWDAAAIEANVRNRPADGPDSSPGVPARSDGPGTHGTPMSSRESHTEERSDANPSITSAIAAYLAKRFSRDGDTAGAEPKVQVPSPEEIARRWAIADQFAASLSYQTEGEFGVDTPTEWKSPGALSLSSTPTGGRFGFDASIGRVQAPSGFESFAGLQEGFNRL
jgi:Ca2+-binding RTX toxin-like protein